MAKVNTIANNGLTIVENYNKLLEQFRKTKTIDDVRILVASAKDFISVYKRVDKNRLKLRKKRKGNEKALNRKRLVENGTIMACQELWTLKNLLPTIA